MEKLLKGWQCRGEKGSLGVQQHPATKLSLIHYPDCEFQKELYYFCLSHCTEFVLSKEVSIKGMQIGTQALLITQL